MNKTVFEKIKNHPDRDEIISKLSIGITAKDIAEWLKLKYSSVGDAKFVISEKNLKAFEDNYLDIWNMFQEDLKKTKLSLKENQSLEDLELSIQNNPSYQNRLLELAGKELDIKQIVTRLCLNIEFRIGQVFDQIQEDPRNINTRVDRLLIEYTKALGDALDKYYKFTTVQPDQVIQHNVNLQLNNQYITVIQEAVRETIANIDVDASMLFLDLVSEKMANLKLPTAENNVLSTDVRLAEAKLLSENIANKLK